MVRTKNAMSFVRKLIVRFLQRRQAAPARLLRGANRPSAAASSHGLACQGQNFPKHERAGSRERSQSLSAPRRKFAQAYPSLRDFLLATEIIEITPWRHRVRRFVHEPT